MNESDKQRLIELTDAIGERALTDFELEEFSLLQTIWSAYQWYQKKTEELRMFRVSHRKQRTVNRCRK